ncbi:hypothetical protein JOD63_003048 [Microbacterium terrae]|uniref:Heparinase II/III-like protein n=1 Tax=Microbacterium terrae TaxID=69369 RepID=A0A0M2H803_9MICO|nr:heparinase II/III family protein [Microbacterium terrae]KJL42650.1 Heparinase II/III-like protein [Microbacterium terrae]MBP1079080.1 hypothetical protein [Microbacterium terrae]GLJ98480.1 heparinase [Microbacterium terrae]
MTPQTEPFQGALAEALRARIGGDALTAERLAGLLSPADAALPHVSAADRSVWGPGGSADAAAVDALVAGATTDLAEPWPLPLASAAARVHIDGDREVWERPAFARQRRLSRAVVAAVTTDDDRFLADVLDGVWLLCEQSSWCWPAHDDAFTVRGSILATADEPYLDLGAGEVIGQLAVIDHVLGERLERRYPGTRARIRRESRLRVIDPFLTRRDWHWLGLDGDVHNWNPWIHGNVLLGALRLLDAPDDAALRAQVVALVIEGIDRYVSVLPLDGAVDEGYAYWWNGACRALEALDVLAYATGGVLDATGVPALRATVAFPHRVHLGGPWYLNVADGQAKPPAAQPWHALHRAARAFGDAAAQAHAAAHRGAEGTPAATETEGLPRLLRGIADAAWIQASPATSPLPRDTWLPSVEVVIAREVEGDATGLTVAAKGGHNGEHHNHNDVGEFIVATDGVPVVIDAGRPTYTLQTFGPDRYDIWTMRSIWHNVPVVAGVEQPPGAASAASGVTVSIDDAETAFDAELAGAYPPGTVGSWHRRVRLDRVARAVEVADSWSAAADGTEVRMLLAGSVELAPGSARVVPLDGATPVLVRWPDDVTARITPVDLDDPMLTAVWGARLTRLDLDVSHRDEVAVTIELDLPTPEDHR